MGPCLCGDIACHSCGNPAAAPAADAADALQEQLDGMQLSLEEYELLCEIIPVIINTRRTSVEREIRARMPEPADLGFDDLQEE